ncbi:hypothetical protein LNP20_17210 [Klebsiella pneumoniae subsp. pneumoniae]|nr:hypothetical protein [Klebsiella pneumoniae subsp. pneumoniae]
MAQNKAGFTTFLQEKVTVRKKDFFTLFRIPAFSPARMMTVWLKVRGREQ